jgi:hypothetical protein
MSGFEDRLRAAMESSVAGEQPPGGLVERVRRRHRRHMARVALAMAVVLLAVAAVIPPTRAALLGHGTRSAGSSAAAGPAAHPALVVRGQYYGCYSQTRGLLGNHWRQDASHAGPIWFINNGIGPGYRFRNPGGTFKAVPLVVLLRNDTTAWVKPAGRQGQYFRFLPGFSNDDRYTLHDGKAEATFAGCSRPATMYGNSSFTEYYIGVIVAGPRCVTLGVQTRGAAQPARTTVRFGGCTT